MTPPRAPDQIWLPMLSQDLVARCRSVPKVELHLHLDGSLSPELAKRADRSTEPLETREALRSAAIDLVDRLSTDGVVYAEIRFAPLLHVRGGLRSDEVVSVVADAVSERAESHGILARLLLCTLRQFTEAQSMETAELAYAFRDRGVVGIDLAGDEATGRLVPHVAAFRYARSKGIGRTAHAGEASGPDNVRAALRALEPMRIGHGVAAIEDSSLVSELAGSRVHFEICPTSNVEAGAYRRIAEHPIDRLFRAGVSVGVNTDTRTLAPVTLSDEYEKLAEAFAWTPEHLERCNLEALEAAFASDAEKARVRERLQQKRQVA